MIIPLFVANSASRVRFLTERNVKGILMSFAYIKTQDAVNALSEAKKKGIRVMVDSGAHSNQFKEGVVTFDRYVDWLTNKGGIDCCHEYVGLDDALKRETTVTNFSRMKKMGLNPLFVDHMWFPWSDEILKSLYAQTGGFKVCWGGLQTGKHSPFGDWATSELSKLDKKVNTNFFQSNSQWKGVCLRIKGRYEHAVKGDITKTHLLAVGNRIRRCLPFLDVVETFDSNSVYISAGFGWAVLACPAEHHPTKGWIPPRLKTVRVTREPLHNQPEEIRRLADSYGLTRLDGPCRDRETFNVEQYKIYYDSIAKFYKEHKPKGFDWLWDRVVKTADHPEPSLTPSEVQIQVPASLPSALHLTDEDFTVEGLAKLSDEVLDFVHSKIHSSWDAEEALPAHVQDQLLQSHLLCHQELHKRGMTPSVWGELDGKEVPVFVSSMPWSSPQLSEQVIEKFHEALSGESKEEDLTWNVLKSWHEEEDEKEKRIVLGVVLEPDTTDAHGDTLSSEEIEQAAHKWLARKQNRGEMHSKIVNHKIEIYESYITPADLIIGKQKVKKGTWLLMLHVLDDTIWGKIKSGEYTGLSMGGYARRRKLGK